MVSDGPDGRSECGSDQSPWVQRISISGVRRGQGRFGVQFQMIDHLTEFVHILEAPIDGGKADVCDVVKACKFRHDAFADQAGGNFAFTGPEKFLFDSGNRGLDPFNVDRALFQGSEHAGSKFVFAEGFAISVALDDAGQGELNGFKRGESLPTFRAFTPPTNLVPLLRKPGIDDSRVIRATKRTSHRNYRNQASG